MNANGLSRFVASWVGLGLFVLGSIGTAADEPAPAAKQSPPTAPALTAEQQTRVDEAAQLHEQVKQLYAGRKYSEALPLEEKALAIRLEVLGEKNADTAESLNYLGAIKVALGQLAKARPDFERALAIRQEILGEEHADTATSLFWMGDAAQRMRDYKSARPYYEQALAIRKKVLGEKDLETITTMHELGTALMGMGDYRAARQCLEQALALRKEVLGEKHPATLSTLSWLGAAIESLGDFPGARKCYEQSLAMHRAVLGERHPDTAGSLNSLGRLFRKTGDFGAARRFFEQALTIRIEALGENNLATAQTLSDLADVLQQIGDYAAARKNLERSLGIYRKIAGENHSDTAMVLNNVGALVEEMGDYTAARHYFEQALAINKELLGEKHPETAVQLNNLGHVLCMMGNFAEAKPYFEQDLAIKKEVYGDKHPDVAVALNNLGRMFLETKDYGTARPYLEQALAIRRESLGEAHPLTALSLDNLGGLLYAMRDYAAARPLYSQALEIRNQALGEAHPETIYQLDNLAKLEAAMGNWDTAARIDDQSRRHVHRHVAQTLPALSEKEQLLFLEGKDSGAFYIALSMGLSQRRDPAIRSLSAAWLLNGKAVAQESLAQRALLAREAREAGNPRLAADARRLLAVRRELAMLSMVPAKPEQETARRERLGSLELEEATLSRGMPQVGGKTNNSQSSVEIDDVRKSLGAGTVLIEIGRFREYDFGDAAKSASWQAPRYVAWIIPPAGQGDVQIVDLGDAEKIDAAVVAARRTFMRPKGARRGLAAEEDSQAEAEESFRQAPANLSALVLQPILAQIGDATTLILSPDASLWLVPWGALPLADGRYAIEQYQIQYVISGRDLVAKKTATVKTSTPIVMADPDYDLTPAGTLAATQAVLRKATPAPAEALAMRATPADRGTISHVERLPGTAKEAQAIAAAMKRKPTVYLGQYALEGVFKALVRPQVLVLSTHGFFLADQEAKPGDSGGAQPSGEQRAAVISVDGKPLENPLLRCGLLLAGCNQRGQAQGDESDSADDGILTGMEILDADLRGTELVVLSACETGLGKVHTGEGVAGLRQAFQLAGAQAVVASLWQVPDAQTAELMGAFFKNLAAGISKADALRRAQLAMIKAHRDAVGGEPFYWAAFTLTGR